MLVILDENDQVTKLHTDSRLNNRPGSNISDPKETTFHPQETRR